MQEFIENMQTGDYEQEGNVQAVLDICAAYINQLEINLLQPAPPGSESNGEFPHTSLDMQVVFNTLHPQITFRLITYWPIYRTYGDCGSATTQRRLAFITKLAVTN